MISNKVSQVKFIEKDKAKKNFIDIIEKLKITNKKEYLDNDEIKKIFDIYRYDDHESNLYYRYIKNCYRWHDRLKNEYPNFETFSMLNSSEIRLVFNKFKSSTLLLIYILSGRVTVDKSFNISNLFEKEQLLHEDSIESIIEACKKYNYSMNPTCTGVIKYICRIIIVKNVKFEDIKMQDIYDCYRNKQDKANATANVLKLLEIIPINEHYDINNRKTFTNVNKIKLKVVHNYYIKEFEDYEKYIDKLGVSPQHKTQKKRVVTQFLNWLEDEYDLIRFEDLEFNRMIEFLVYLREWKINEGKKYSDKTYISMRSQFKMFVDYLVENNKMNEEFILDFHKTNVFFGAITEIKYEKELITTEEIAKIADAIINFNEYKLLPSAPDVLKILYFLGMRPTEAIHLKYDCLKGTKEAPTLHIHKGKNGEDRYIPLTSNIYNIIKKHQEINKDSLPIYSVYDDLNVKRLFSYRNKLIDKTTLNRRLKELEVEQGIVNEKGEAKFPLYTLRKIRITILINSGVNIEYIKKLVGHRDIESQLFYYISEENLIDNALKVFNGLYSKYVDENGNIDSQSYSIDQENIEEDYIEELKRDLVIIENKEVFSYAIEMAKSDYPELFFPLMNGSCGAMMEWEGDFECEMINLPCLECEDLKSSSRNIEMFDKYAVNLYKHKNIYEKKGVDGLMEKSKSTIDRLKQFYVKTFELDEKVIDERFKNLSKMAVKKRGRRKKVL